MGRLSSTSWAISGLRTLAALTLAAGIRLAALTLAAGIRLAALTLIRLATLAAVSRLAALTLTRIRLAALTLAARGSVTPILAPLLPFSPDFPSGLHASLLPAGTTLPIDILAMLHRVLLVHFHSNPSSTDTSTAVTAFFGVLIWFGQWLWLCTARLFQFRRLFLA
jgi:hypothetical protein